MKQPTVNGLITWLRKKPASKTYCYLDHGNCLISQFLRSLGYQKIKVYAFGHFEHNGNNARYPAILDDIACRGERTFGEALKRASASLAS